VFRADVTSLEQFEAIVPGIVYTVPAGGVVLVVVAGTVVVVLVESEVVVVGLPGGRGGLSAPPGASIREVAATNAATMTVIFR
jgi:hypothetical protein